MEKKLKVIIADDTTELGHTCANALKSYGMDVSLCEKDGMSLLEKIVYVADIIEITRGSALDEVRKKVYANFDEGFLACLKSSYNYAARRVGVENVHKLTKDAIKSYRKLAREKNEKRKIDQ